MQRRRNLFSKPIAFFAWVSVLMLWGCALSSYVSPQTFKYLGVLTLGFPFFVGLVVMMEFVVLIFARRWWWIPLLGLLGCAFTIRTYFPINFSSDVPDGSIKFMTYNVCGYGNKAKNDAGINKVADYIVRSKADIVCLQEAYMYPPKMYKEVVSYISRTYPYSDTLHLGENRLTCYSKYPIVGKERINRVGANGAGAYLLQMPDGDTLRVVNCHLRSMQLSLSDRATYRNMVHATEEMAVTDTTSRRLLKKIALAAVVRSKQADRISEYLEQHEGENIILCGDFNDSPLSYAHQSFRSKGLNDAYAEAGKGLGRTFNKDAIIVRIDHILHSDHWTAYNTRVDKEMRTSDHYPVYTYLKRNKTKK
jgi:endonuclease/exonuclease/phosphatase (EEP) superfamily protein YafD